MSEERDELVQIVRGLLAKQAEPAAVRTAIESEEGFDRDLWRTLCEQVGVAALAVPEEYDGAGASLAETAGVLEELAYVLAPAPLLASSLATAALLLGGTDEAKAELLPRLAAGEVGALAWSAPAGDLVLDATAAEVVLSVQDGTLRHHPDARATRVAALDPTLRLGTLEPGDSREVGLVDEDVLRDLGLALVSAEQVGAARRGLDLTTEYLKTRVQFGRPIGSFQAIKHRMADVLMLTEMMRSASLGAVDAAAAYLASRSDEDRATLATRSAAAKSYASDALEQVAAETIQLHGGIGITWEHDSQLVFKRALALNTLFGPAHAHRARLLA